MSDEARCTVTVTIHPWCRNIERDIAVREYEDGREEPLPTLEECIGMMAKTGSPSSEVEHQHKGNDMGTNHDASPGARASEREGPSPAGTGADTAGSALRTERVTLEITHYDGIYCNFRKLNWNQIMADAGQGVNKSFCVVEEPLSDALAQGLNRLTDERDAAIREREELRRSFYWSEKAGTRLLAERDASLDDADGLRTRVAELEGEAKGLRRDAAAAKNRVAVLEAGNSAAHNVITSLESQLESVADRAAAAETALEAAPAASGWRILALDEPPQIDDQFESSEGQWCRVYPENIHLCTLPHRYNYRRRVTAPAASGAAVTEAMRELRDAAVCLPHCGGERLQRAIAAAERLLTDPRPAVPASDAAERMADTVDRLEAMSQDPGRTVVWEEFDDAAGTEVLAWGVIVHREAEVLCVPFTVREAADHFVSLNGVNETMTVIPLYAAPQPAAGVTVKEVGRE